MPTPDRLLPLLRQAAALFRATPGRVGRLVRPPAGAEVVVAGDMHGNVENFRLLLRAADLAAHPGRHLVLQEVTHGPFRYPDGGDKSHQLLDLIAALKCQYPTRVHFLLGNHELAQWRRQAIAKGDDDQNVLFRRGLDAAYGPRAAEVEEALDALFASADLAVRTANRVFLSHSLPAARHLERFDPALLESPDPPAAEWQAGGSLHALVWGRDTRDPTAAAYLQKVDADLLITGHIPCDEGYTVAGPRHLILDSLGTPACYCAFPTDAPLTLNDLVDRVRVL